MNNRQVQHELELFKLAKDKLRKDLRKAQEKNYGSSTNFSRDFIRQYVQPFAKELVKATGKRARGRATTSAISLGFRKMQEIFEYLVDPEMVAYISMISILDSFYTCEGSKPKVQEGFKKIGRRLEDEMRNEFYYQRAPEDVVAAIHERNNRKESTPSYRRQGAKQIAQKLLVNKYDWTKEELFQDWMDSDRFHVGAFVLHVAEGFGIVESYPLRQGKKQQTYYRLSEPVKAQSIIFQSELEQRAFFRYPFKDIPREWELESGASRHNNSGGYYQAWIRTNLNLCRSFYSDTEFGTDAINLLNTLSRTAWNVDHTIYNLAYRCLEKGYSIGSLNAVFDHPRLHEDMPKFLEARPKSDLLRKEWRSETAQIHKAHKKAVTKSRNTRLALTVAKDYLKETRFYLSWSCDYRGRMYPQQSFLHQDSSDFERSLITFSDGCKLDKSGEEYAAQAVGEAFLGSKVNYEDRSKWTYQNKELILAIANTPLSLISEWEGCDKPWQFLQLALEWNRVVLNKQKALWDVPIGADATSSGLQLLSAMRCDPDGMKFSNLLAPKDINEPPRDAYKEVLSIARLTALRDEKHSWIADYLKDRKLGKIVLMTVVYGATTQSQKRDIKQHFMDKGLYPSKIDKQAVSYICTILREAAREVFPMAFEAMDWIKDLYRIAQKNGNTSFTWTTPNLDSINLLKVEQLSKRIKSTYLGYLTIPLTEIKEPNYKKMKTSLVPDFVHSYDSCVLKSSFQDWIKPLTVVHDCFKVLPNDMDLAKKRIRHGFYKVCSGDPLAQLADNLGVTEEQLPRLQQGTGCLEDVLNSSYMFN